MSATTKLYQDDSLQLQFSSRIVGALPFGDQPAIQLSATAFYPEGGGQPGDHGHLIIDGHQVEVIDVQIDNAEQIHHLVRDIPSMAIGDAVTGMVDERRRRDFMSQHTGQHMLSALVDQTMACPTISARLGSQHGTIDVDGDPDIFTPEKMAALEIQLQAVVLEDRPLGILYPNAEELVKLGLRRAPKVSEGIRIIEISGFDKTPCGGTHCQRTGQVGPIKIIGKERYKGMTRLSFLAGQRALHYLWQNNQTLQTLAQEVGCAPGELAGQYQKLRSETKALQQQVGLLRSQLITAEVDDILSQLSDDDMVQQVHIREGEAYRASRQFAIALAEHPKMVAIVASREEKGADWRIMVIRGNEADFNCGAWFRGPGKTAGARGGGKPDRAEGILKGDVDPHSLNWE